MSKLLQGKLSISRVHCGHGDDYMNLSIVDESSGVQFVDVQIDIKTFMDVLTGMARQPCEFELRRPDRVGMIKEGKTVLMPQPEWNATDEDIEKLFFPFEINGWVGTRENIKNHHNYRGDRVQVSFHRFVEPSPEE